MVTPLTKVMDLTFLPGRGQYPPPRIFWDTHTHTHTLTPNYSQATTRRTERTTKKRSETDHRLLICVCAHTNFAFLF